MRARLRIFLWFTRVLRLLIPFIHECRDRFAAVPTESKWKSVGDLVAAAKAEPGKINVGSWGIGSPGHLGGEEMQLLTKTDMSHVAFREMSQLFSSVATGDVHWSFGSIPSSQG